MKRLPLRRLSPPKAPQPQFPVHTAGRLAGFTLGSTKPTYAWQNIQCQFHQQNQHMPQIWSNFLSEYWSNGHIYQVYKNQLKTVGGVVFLVKC